MKSIQIYFIPMHEEEQKIIEILEAFMASKSNKISQVTIHVSLELMPVSDICPVSIIKERCSG
jgi:hypothetical protein